MRRGRIIIGAVLIGLFLGGGFGWWQYRELHQSIHQTYFLQQTDLYDSAYQNVGPIVNVDRPIKGLLVNHHLLAAQLIAGTFNQVASRDPITVILLSPNHFDAGNGKFLTSTWDWQTSYGRVSADKKLIKQLAKQQLVKIDNLPFDNEHGVGNIMPFIRKSLPKAKILPIIFRNNLAPVEVKEWVDIFSRYLPDNSLIVASLDMSHYVAENIAVKQDANTLVAIQTLNATTAWQQKVDSPATLSAYLQLIKTLGELRFNLLVRSSSTLLGGALPQDNTSYITGFFY